MNVADRIKLEKRIAKAFVKAVLAAGFAVTVDDGGGIEESPLADSTDGTAILNAMFSTDMDRLYIVQEGKRIGWALFIYGNDGWDVLADYTVNLEPYMAGVNAIASKYE